MRNNIRYFLFFIFFAMLIFGCDKKKEQHYFLFSYFTGNGEDGLHLVASTDGFVWEKINDGKSMLFPLVGESALMRDPCITMGPDSTFHMVWTTSWSGKTIGYAHSKDLENWSKQIAIPVMAHEDSVMNCWAPEINYDDGSKEFIIYWSSTITNKFPETAHSTKNGNKRNHRIYYTATKDFKSFADTKLLYDPGINVIDASIKKDGDRYVMFIKNETELPKAEKNISVVFADKITGPYGPMPTKPITGEYWAEGPTGIEIDGKWHVYFDKYMDKTYGLITSSDPENWTDESEKLVMPNGLKHGTIFEVSQEMFEKLMNIHKKPVMLYRDSSRKGRPYAKDPSVVFYQGKYWMYYTIPDGPKKEQNGWHIGIAASDDMNNWEKIGEMLPAETYEENGLCAPGAKVINNEIHLFYQTYGNGPKDAICHAVSSDGLHFTRNKTNPIFAPSGKWNIGRAIDADVFIKGDSAYLFWATRDKEYKQQLLGVSKAPVSGGYNRKTWRQISTAPLLKPELPWEMNCIEAATVFEDGGDYYMFYAGAYNTEGQQIGLAKSTDLVNWTRTSDLPVMTKGKDNEWNSTESGHPGVFIDPDGTKWLFFQGNPDKGYTYYLSKRKFEISEDDKVVFD